MRRVLLWGVACVLCLSTVTADAARISVTPFYFAPDLDVRARIEKNNIGEEIHFEDELGMDDEDVYGITVDLLLGRSNHFLFSYWTVDYDGDQVLSSGFEFNGRLYGAGDRVRSSFDVDTWEFGYAFDLLNFETFRAGFLLNVHWYSVETELTSDANPRNEDSIDLLFPLPGVRVGKGFLENKLWITGQLAGMWWQASGWWDTRAELSFYPIKNLGVSAGYRAMHLDVSDDDDSANMKFDGFTGSVTYRF